jgi:hypothetical protein
MAACKGDGFVPKDLTLSLLLLVILIMSFHHL